MKAEQLFLSSCLAGLLLMFVYRSDNGGILQSLFRGKKIISLVRKDLIFVKSLHCK